MKKWKYVALVASLLAISHTAVADNRGVPFVAGIITGAILASPQQASGYYYNPPVGYNPPPPRVIYREVPSQVVYVIQTPAGYTRQTIDMQEDAYWAGYRAAHHDEWRGHEYGYGYRRYSPYDN